MDADVRMARSWPASHEGTAGGWLVRANGGTTRRANSALASPTRDLGATIEAVEAFYAERNAPTLVLVSELSAPTGLADFLVERGYAEDALTDVMAADATSVLTTGGPPPEHMVRTTDDLTTEWFDLFWSTRDQTTTSADAYRYTLTAPPQTVFGVAYAKRIAAAAGQAVVWGDTAVLQCMVTRPDFRQLGFAAALLHGLASACVARGVSTLELGVLANNTAAKGLYEKAGFERRHGYRYLGQPASTQ